MLVSGPIDIYLNIPSLICSASCIRLLTTPNKVSSAIAHSSNRVWIHFAIGLTFVGVSTNNIIVVHTRII